MPAPKSDRPGFVPVGGVCVRNRKGQPVLWFKGKDSDDAPSFALCLFMPELADDDEMRRMLSLAFTEIKRAARTVGLPMFDAVELQRQLPMLAEQAVASHFVADEASVVLTDLATGNRSRLNIKIRSPEAG